MDILQIIADRKIREAMENGAFDDLEGRGQELDLSENPFEDPATRMANRLMRNNGFLPAWIEESREIEEHRARLGTAPEAGTESSARRSEVAALNRRITLFNLKVPLTQQKLPAE